MRYLTIILAAFAFLATPMMSSISYAECSGRPTCPGSKPKTKKVMMKCKKGKVYSTKMKKCVKKK